MLLPHESAFRCLERSNPPLCQPSRPFLLTPRCGRFPLLGTLTDTTVVHFLSSTSALHVTVSTPFSLHFHHRCETPSPLSWSCCHTRECPLGCLQRSNPLADRLHDFSALVLPRCVRWVELFARSTSPLLPSPFPSSLPLPTVSENTGARTTASGLADAVDVATSAVAAAESLKGVGFYRIVAEYGNQTATEPGTKDAVSLPHLSGAAKHGSLTIAGGSGIAVWWYRGWCWCWCW